MLVQELVMFFFLLSIFAEEPMPAPKINTFWPNPAPENEKVDLLLKPIP